MRISNLSLKSVLLYIEPTSNSLLRFSNISLKFILLSLQPDPTASPAELPAFGRKADGQARQLDQFSASISRVIRALLLSDLTPPLVLQCFVVVLDRFRF